jgi:uncharacterized protein YbjT (DUF2867 family)
MKLLVTGASGHLGANLVRRLLDEGQALRVRVQQGSDNRAVDGLPVERVLGDPRDFAAMQQAMKGIARVYQPVEKQRAAV